jgi:hypothetical protein
MQHTIQHYFHPVQSKEGRLWSYQLCLTFSLFPILIVGGLVSENQILHQEKALKEVFEVSTQSNSSKLFKYVSIYHE